MNPDLQKTASKLQSDVQKVSDAYGACATVIAKAKETHKENGLQISPNIRFALWADLKFGGNWDNFSAYVDEAITNYKPNSRPDTDKSQMWISQTPDRVDHHPDVDRTLDRIDVAFHVITKDLGMELPFETVRTTSNGFGQGKHIQRVMSFCDGISDVLNPSGG